MSFFTAPHDLATQVIVSFVNLRDSRPAVGFIRADQAADLKKYTELLEENARLKTEISKLERSDMPLFREALEQITLIASSVGNEIVKTCSWGELFVSSCENIIKGSDIEFQIRSGMSGWITGDQENSSRMSDEQFDRIKFRFVGRRLVVIELVSRTRRGENREVRVWKLTDYGQAQYGLLMP